MGSNYLVLRVYGDGSVDVRVFSKPVLQELLSNGHTNGPFRRIPDDQRGAMDLAGSPPGAYIWRVEDATPVAVETVTTWKLP